MVLNADWALVIITAVYVVATIIICFANIKAARVANSQLEEMRKQYDEENRPYIDAEFVFERRYWYIVRFVNHGKHAAQHVKINIEQSFFDSISGSSLANLLEEQKDKECIIGAGQHHDLAIGNVSLREITSIKPFSGIVSYEHNGKTYTDNFEIDIKNYMTFFSTVQTNTSDTFIRLFKDLNQQVQGIKEAVNDLQYNENLLPEVPEDS